MQYTLDQLFATHCAPALTGVAPANLISLRRGEFPQLDAELRKYQRAFARRGICFSPLCSCARHELILVYRPRQLAKTLARPGVGEILASWGYDLSQPLEQVLAHLSQRVDQGGTFPHEIGLFLGYPVEDVVGFMEHKGQNFKLCGPWKVYGDVEAAKRCFARIQRVSQNIRERIDGGKTLFQVFAVA